MIATIEISPKYEQGHTELDAKGNIILAQEDTVYEVVERLTSIRGTYIFDTAYGSDLFNLVNKHRINNAEAENIVRESLSPMIAQGKIQDRLVVLPYIQGSLIIIKVVVYNKQGKEFTAIFRSMLTI